MGTFKVSMTLKDGKRIHRICTTRDQAEEHRKLLDLEYRDLTHPRRAPLPALVEQIVYVVMGNDYPGAVFGTQKAAQEYVDDERAHERGKLDYPEHQYRFTNPRVYWRVYEFVLDSSGRHQLTAAVYS